MDIQNALAKLRIIGILLWNFALFFLAFGFSLLLGHSDLYPAAIFYFFVGVLTSFWTYHLAVTLIPSLVAFPCALFSFASAVYSDDTGGEYSLSLRSLWELMDRRNIEALMLSVVAASLGWVAIKFLFRRRKNWAEKSRPYLFSLSALVIFVYLVLVILHW